MKSALGAIFYREYKIRTTNLVWLFFDLLVPMMYLLIFGLGFTRAMGGGVPSGRPSCELQRVFLSGRDRYGVLRSRDERKLGLVHGSRQRHL